MHSFDRFLDWSELEIPGAFLITYNTHLDNRGTFTKILTPEVFTLTTSATQIAQINLSRNSEAGTWRGFHVQGPPQYEAKLIHCLAGEVNDYLVDLRSNSKNFGRVLKIHLDSRVATGILISPGIGHGYQTLTSDSEILYVHNQHWAPDATHVLDYLSDDIHLELDLAVTQISSADSKGKNLDYFEKLDW